MLKKFALWIIKNLIVILIATLIFSSITLNFPVFMQNLFGDIYSYSSPEAQKDAVGRLTESCSSTEGGKEVVTMQQLCANASMLAAMKENCANYRELKRKGAIIENAAEMQQSCEQIESGEIEEQCSQMNKKSLLPDFSRIGVLCKDYNSGKINDRQFFYSVIGSALGNSKTPKMGLFDRYTRLIDYLNNNKLLYLMALTILVILLYFIIGDIRLFYATVVGISFSIGILILLPYFGIILYDKFVGIDTTSILQGMFGFGVFDPKALLSVVLLMFLRTYNSFIITVGILFLAAGIVGKVYMKFFISKNGNLKTDGRKIAQDYSKAKKKKR